MEKKRPVEVFPEQVRELWDLWELRILVLISHTLQISLTVLGSRRKYNPSTLLRLSLWSAYLTADWVATIALGVLSNNQRPSCTCDIDSISNTTNPINDELSAFWAPFLLLHLGGPDTITTYALADNELWIRHLLGLVVQMIVAIYITVTAWSWTWLSFLTIPMLFAQLECTDAAGRVPHPSSTRRDAGRGVRRGWLRVGAASAFFFFFFSDLCRLGSIRADAARFAPNRLRFAPNRANSARIGPYRPYQWISAGDRYGRNRPESAETCRNQPWKSPERPKFWPQMRFLPYSFFVLWIKYINVFFKNILIVKIYRKYK